MKIFSESHLSDYLESCRSRLMETVQSQNQDWLLNVNELEYVAYLLSQFCVEPIVFAWDQVYLVARDESIPAEWFPRQFIVDAGKRYPRQVITYHMPFSGNGDLLKCRPSSAYQMTYDVDVRNGEVCFEVIDFDENPEMVKAQADPIRNHIASQNKNVLAEVEQYNLRLQSDIPGILKQRKDEILRRRKVLSSLGVEVRQCADVPKTFAVPIARKQILPRPVSSMETYIPEPTLEEADYGAITHVITELGREMERHPQIYEGKSEEALRDLFLMMLAPHFASATGETFNKQGKTDILIRHEGKNLFVAECKIWHGASMFCEAIDQLLSYLTWRDSKTAVICFVRNKELQPVLDSVDLSAKAHTCFLKDLVSNEQGCFSYIFRMPDDATRNVYVNVLCFHLSP